MGTVAALESVRHLLEPRVASHLDALAESMRNADMAAAWDSWWALWIEREALAYDTYRKPLDLAEWYAMSVGVQAWRWLAGRDDTEKWMSSYAALALRQGATK